MSSEWSNGVYLISTDAKRLDVKLIHHFLSTDSYWAQRRTVELVERSLRNSLNFGLYEGEAQIGFARVVSDYATFAWLADVFVLPSHRGRGLSKWLLATIVNHKELSGLRRWVLATRDAHELYRRFGFTELQRSDLWMERCDTEG